MNHDIQRFSRQQPELLRSIQFDEETRTDPRLGPFAWGALFGFCVAILILC